MRPTCDITSVHPVGLVLLAIVVLIVDGMVKYKKTVNLHVAVVANTVSTPPSATETLKNNPDIFNRI